MSNTGIKNIYFDKSRNKYCLEFYAPSGKRTCRFMFCKLNDAIDAKGLVEKYGIKYYKENFAVLFTKNKN